MTRAQRAVVVLLSALSVAIITAATHHATRTIYRTPTPCTTAIRQIPALEARITALQHQNNLYATHRYRQAWLRSGETPAAPTLQQIGPTGACR